MASESFIKLKDFYENSPLALKATKPLKKGAVAEVQFEDDPESYTLLKEQDHSVIKPGKPKKPEIYMKFTADAVDYLYELHQQGKDDIEEWMTRFSECILNPTRERKIEFRICANLVTVARMGYFGMMRLGGKRAVSIAMKLGVKVPKKFIKDLK